jgi:hypothetical protein
METVLNIVFFLVIFFYLKSIIITDDSPNNKRNKDGSFDNTVSSEYVNSKLNSIDIEHVKCPTCGMETHNLDWFEFRTSKESWKHLGGRAGFYSKCPKCDIIVFDITTMMN